MLLCTRTHFIRSLEHTLAGREGDGTDDERNKKGQEMLDRMRLYASDETAKAPGVDVFVWSASLQAKLHSTEEEKGSFKQLISGRGPQPAQQHRVRGWWV